MDNVFLYNIEECHLWLCKMSGIEIDTERGRREREMVSMFMFKVESDCNSSPPPHSIGNLPFSLHISPHNNIKHFKFVLIISYLIHHNVL